MNHQKLQPYFLLSLLAGILILAFFIIRPFLPALVLAAVFAVVFQPLYRLISRASPSHPGLTSVLTTLAVIIIILVPLSLLGNQIFREAEQLYHSLAANSENSEINLWSRAVTRLEQLLPGDYSSAANLEQYAKRILEWLIAHLALIFSSFSKWLLSVLIFFMSLYYLFRDGGRLKRAIIFLSPLADPSDETILARLEQAVNSVIKGNLTVALIQGFLTGIGFAIFGLPQPVLWGTVAAVAALIPGLGTALVLTPAILFLWFSGAGWGALGLLVWGALAVGLIDNFLGPKLVGRGARLPPLLVLLSVLGGLSFFGPVGFLLGPLVFSLLFALLDIYSHLTGNSLEKNA